MKINRTGELFNRSWADKDTGYKKKDYTPLSERNDWDGKVEVVPGFRKVAGRLKCHDTGEIFEAFSRSVHDD